MPTTEELPWHSVPAPHGGYGEPEADADCASSSHRQTPLIGNRGELVM